MGRPKVHYIDTRILFLQIAFIALAVILGVSYLRWTKVTRVQFSSPEFKSSWEITDQEVVRGIAAGVKEASQINGAEPENIYVMKLFSKKETRVYLFASPEVIYDIKGSRCLQPFGQLRGVLNKAAEELRLRSPYGQLMQWEEAQQLLPPGENVKIFDVDTGKSFHAVRKGGYSHADIKPVTENDSKVIREIFGGTWCWKKRAVVVQSGGIKFAAALTGMPHLQNGESGCFDLRLPLTGDRNKGDTVACRLMYYKASGRLDEVLQEANPYETILLLFTAIDQRDWQSARLMLTSPEGVKQNKLEKLIGVSVLNIKEKEDLVYRLSVSVSFTDGPYNNRRNIEVQLRQDKKTGTCVAEPEFLATLFAGE
ncbi:hypothetical protein [Phosphitispora fastidiosa]|uniref:hypothetical protein n=1 Tax=Phosphitispora fastidiosa TaxID=2837202 RepID=UPI001E2B5963|nr:hypothetical protein [Phosphitispora fastidiosa]MBU7005304.1 hypothetical protein [Phosphitispora fastidiosa]